MILHASGAQASMISQPVLLPALAHGHPPQADLDSTGGRVLEASGTPQQYVQYVPFGLFFPRALSIGKYYQL